MLRLFLVIGLALLGGGVAAVLLRDNPGYVLIEIGPWQLETTLAALVLMLILALLALSVALRLLRWLFVMPTQIREAVARQKLARGRAQFEKGLLALRTERWQAAELALLKHVSDAPAPALSYLGAAEAAHRQGARQRRDEYLALAEQQAEAPLAAIDTARARWAQEQGDWGHSLQALERAGAQRGHSAQAVQALRLRALEQSERWQDLQLALPESLGALPRPELDALGKKAEIALLRQAGAKGALDQLRLRWQSLAKPLRQDADVLLAYAEQLHRLGADAEALRLIPPQLKAAWHAELVQLYGQLHSEDGVAQLAHIEQWLNQYGEKPELLLIAGRLCAQNRFWGRARSYLEAAQRIQPGPAVALELGRLRAQDKDEAGALEAYRRGLELAVSSPSTAAKALPAPGDRAQN
ncbi:MAG: heme biosynthesis HemY N-terminal domain-containing protein [Oceanococcaceae bacterium]